MIQELNIGPFRIETHRSTIEGPDGAVRVEHRSMEVLLALARHGDEVVEREELLTEVWGDVAVTEEVLTHCIWELRKAFADDARRPSYIQTIPRRGYRLIAPVVKPAEVAESTLAAVVGVHPGFQNGEPSPSAVRRAALWEDLVGAQQASAVRLGELPAASLARPSQAVELAIAFHRESRRLRLDGGGRAPGIAIHVAEAVTLPGGRELTLDDTASELLGQLARLAGPYQTLLSRSSFDLARSARTGASEELRALRWLAHGPYRFPASPEPVQVFEVGAPGTAPLSPPEETPDVRRIDDGTLTGWRAAAGLMIPRRRNWILERRLGGGGFGEVWLAAQEKTGERRIFKFCHREETLWSLQREVTLFRFLKQELGAREDMAPILDWDLETAPYYIEAAYSNEGSLTEWVEAQGGLAAVRPETRWEIVAQTAVALAAAHSVGVLHKDVKPGNLLIEEDGEGRPRVRLADFGIGQLLDRRRFEAADITRAGLTAAGRTSQLVGDSGTRLYMAPELLEGKAPSVQADLYALGVLLYQLAAGDLGRPLAPGWERDVDDPLVRQDIAELVDGDPENRPQSARLVAERLRRLPARHAARRAHQEAEELERRGRRRRRLGAALLGAALVLAAAMSYHARTVSLEAETSERVVQLLLDLFQGADPMQPADGEPTLRQVLDRAAGRLDELADRPVVRARLMTAIGQSYVGLHETEAAGPLLEGALDLRRHHLAPRAAEVGESLHALGRLRFSQERYDEAMPLLGESLAVRRMARGEPGAEVAESLTSLGLVEMYRGQLGPARERLQEAVAIYRRLAGEGGDVRLAGALSDLGELYAELGETALAVDVQREAVAIFRRDLPSGHVLLGMGLNSLAASLTASGDPAAPDSFREALAIIEPRFGERSLPVAITRSNLAQSLIARGDHAEAVEILNGLLELWEALADVIGGRRQPMLARSHYHLGAAHHRLGNLRVAEGHHTEALALRREILPPGHPEVIESLRALAAVLRERGEEAAAARLEEEAVGSAGSDDEGPG